MYDRVKIITGLVIFVLLVLIPFLYNGKASKAVPELSLPTTAKHCVLPADEMRAHAALEYLARRGGAQR